MLKDKIQDYSVINGVSYFFLPFYVFLFAKSRIQISD